VRSSIDQESAPMPRPSYRHLDTVDDVIDAIGGSSAIAQLTGRGRTAVSNWRSWERFPACLHALMTEALLQRGCVASPALWGQAVKDQIAA